MRQEANLHIETFQLLLLGLLRVCSGTGKGGITFLYSEEKSLSLSSYIITGLHFSAETLSY